MSGSGCDLSIIIVNWNSLSYLKKCIESLYKKSGKIESEIIVVDNGSFDGSGEYLAANNPEISFIQIPANRGFAYANNRGASIARGKYLLFLNPDTEVSNDSICSLHDAAIAYDKAGAIGCKLLNSDRSLQTSCIMPFPTIFNLVLDIDYLKNLTRRASFWGIRALYSVSSKPEIVQAISGACVMIEKSVFNEIGGFNENYFMYTEDIDLCYKTHIAGYDNLFLGYSSVIHHGGGSTGTKKTSKFSDVLMRETMYKFFQIYRGTAYAEAFRFSIGFAAIVRLTIISLIGLPLLFFKRGARIMNAFIKSKNIVRWALGLERWASRKGSIE